MRLPHIDSDLQHRLPEPGQASRSHVPGVKKSCLRWIFIGFVSWQCSFSTRSFRETALTYSKCFQVWSFSEKRCLMVPQGPVPKQKPSHPLETEHLFGKHNNGSARTDVTLGNCLAHFSLFQLKEREQPQNKSHCRPMFRNHGLRCCSFRCFLSWISPVWLSQSEIQCSFKSSVAFL